METLEKPNVVLRCSGKVPPSGGSLEIGNVMFLCNTQTTIDVPPSGGSLEIGNVLSTPKRERLTMKGSPFGGIPRNWKHKNPGK